MDKQELVKKYEETIYAIIATEEVLKDLKQLDEPQKPVLPRFVADWIEKCKAIKKFIPSLAFAINSEVWSENNLSDECINWLYNANNQEIFARAWLDGYEVEQEKRYRVKMKGINDSYCVLTHYEDGNRWIMGTITNNCISNKIHTRKELEDAGFGEVFNSPLFEVEEVEE